MGVVALALVGRVDDHVSAGAIALAVVPAPLVAVDVVSRLRGRADLAGALVLGTVVVALLVAGSRGALAAGALFTATEAYALSAMFANVLPTVRDALLAPLRWLGWTAPVVVLGLAALAAPPLDGVTVLVALAILLTGGLAAWIAALALERDPLAAVAGAGLRDPALAVGLASITAGSDAAGVPLVYAVGCVVLAAIARVRSD